MQLHKEQRSCDDCGAFAMVPAETIAHIADFMDFSSFMRFYAACKRFGAALEDAPQWLDRTVCGLEVSITRRRLCIQLGMFGKRENLPPCPDFCFFKNHGVFFVAGSACMPREEAYSTDKMHLFMETKLLPCVYERGGEAIAVRTRLTGGTFHHVALSTECAIDTDREDDTVAMIIRDDAGTLYKGAKSVAVYSMTAIDELSQADAKIILKHCIKRYYEDQAERAWVMFKGRDNTAFAAALCNVSTDGAWASDVRVEMLHVRRIPHTMSSSEVVSMTTSYAYKGVIRNKARNTLNLLKKHDNDSSCQQIRLILENMVKIFRPMKDAIKIARRWIKTRDESDVL